MVSQGNFQDGDWGWSTDETGMGDEHFPPCACGRPAHESCGCCGAPLCFMCCETGAGFCAGLPCATEELLDELDQRMRGNDETEA